MKLSRAVVWSQTVLRCAPLSPGPTTFSFVEPQAPACFRSPSNGGNRRSLKKRHRQDKSQMRCDEPAGRREVTEEQEVEKRRALSPGLGFRL